MSQTTVEEPTELQPRTPISLSDIVKFVLMIGLGVAGLLLEVYGFKSGHLTYVAIVIVLLVATTGLSGFTNSYNRLQRAPDKIAVRNSLKLSAEKAASIGVVSLTFGVALSLYNLDATNSEANFSKLQSIQKQMMPKVQQLGCKFTADETARDCKSLHDALNNLWGAVLTSDVKGMAAGVDNVRLRWAILSARWPYQNLDEFNAAIEGLDKLKYRLDEVKPVIALLLAALLLPFSIAATSRKLAVAAFEADFSEVPVTWRMVSKRALFSVVRTMLPWKWRSD